MKKIITLILTDEITTTGEIKILPMGFVESTKGNFYVDDESIELMREAFNEHGVDIVIDYEHQTLEDTKAPAAGWIKDFYVKDGAVVAVVDWTAEAKKYVKNKEYRYLSPVVFVRKKDKKAIQLHSVALTNTPAIDIMYPIVNSNKIINSERDGNMEFFERLRALLGLDETATEDNVIEALESLLTQANNEGELDKLLEDDEESFANDDDTDELDELEKEIDNSEEVEEDEEKEEVISNKAILKMLGLKDNPKNNQVISTIMALKNPTKKHKNNSASLEVKALKDKLRRQDATKLVSLALKQGKITPAQKSWAYEYALSSPKQFIEFTKKSPVVVPTGQIKVDKQKILKPSEQDLIVCKMLGLSEADIKKYGKGDR